MSRDAIIEKIKKLLRMKRGGSQGEIENALAMAAELARKHGIDLGDIDPDAPDARPISHDDVMTSARLQKECVYAALVCQNFFNVTSLITDAPCKTFRRWRDFKIIFIGEVWDLQIAIYIFGFLIGHFRRCWNHRLNKRIRNRDAFMNGIYQGLCQKLYLERTQTVAGEGLIRLDQQIARRADYMKNNFGETEEKNMKPADDSGAAKRAGWIAGRQTEIRSGLDKSSPARAALPAPAPKQIALL